MSIELREVTPEVREDLRSVRLGPGQDRFVASIEKSFADAAEVPEANPWYRAVYLDGDPVGFVMISWNVEPRPGIQGPWYLWRLLVDERRQGQGVGREIVLAIVDIIRAEGGDALLTSYVDEPGGPAGFYRRLGFVPTGEMDDGEVVTRLRL
jgi:GNAT superfamily N-acetyltransferase